MSVITARSVKLLIGLLLLGSSAWAEGYQFKKSALCFVDMAPGRDVKAYGELLFVTTFYDGQPGNIVTRVNRQLPNGELKKGETLLVDVVQLDNKKGVVRIGFGPHLQFDVNLIHDRNEMKSTLIQYDQEKGYQIIENIVCQASNYWESI